MHGFCRWRGNICHDLIFPSLGLIAGGVDIMHFWEGQAELSASQWIARAVVFYIALFLTARVMGQRSIANLRLVDFITAIVIGNLIAHPLSDSRLPFSGALLALAVFALFHFLLAWLSTLKRGFRMLIESRPIKLIENGRILPEGLAKARINHDILLSELRLNNATSPEEVAMAALEPNGRISVIKKGANRPATPEDLRIAVPEVNLPIILIENGVTIEENLRLLGLSKEILTQMLASLGVNDPGELFLAYLDSERRAHVIRKPASGNSSSLCKI